MQSEIRLPSSLGLGPNPIKTSAHGGGLFDRVIDQFVDAECPRRAVESYWRSRMIDGATSNEDKVTSVYKLEEIYELLRSSHVSIVKEVSEFILKRLENKSPIVKQKSKPVVARFSDNSRLAELRFHKEPESAVAINVDLRTAQVWLYSL
nr:vhs domain-containing protein [Quercus suber]